VLSASVLFVFGHRFRVEDYCLAVYCEVGSIPKGLLRGFTSTWVYFHFFYFLGRAKGPGKREGAQIASHS
jgi:hypothetical protein